MQDFHCNGKVVMFEGGGFVENCQRFVVSLQEGVVESSVVDVVRESVHHERKLLVFGKFIAVVGRKGGEEHVHGLSDDEAVFEVVVRHGAVVLADEEGEADETLPIEANSTKKHGVVQVERWCEKATHQNSPKRESIMCINNNGISGSSFTSG